MYLLLKPARPINTDIQSYNSIIAPAIIWIDIEHIACEKMMPIPCHAGLIIARS